MDRAMFYCKCCGKVFDIIRVEFADYDDGSCVCPNCKADFNENCKTIKVPIDDRTAMALYLGV